MTEPGTGTARPAAHGLLCPACRVDLVMSERAGVEIDYCPRCRGVWLDRGELDKILERSATELGSAAPSPEPARLDPPRQHHAPQYEQRDPRHQDHRPYDHRYHKRKKSFLDDLFDFD